LVIVNPGGGNSHVLSVVNTLGLDQVFTVVSPLHLLATCTSYVVYGVKPVSVYVFNGAVVIFTVVHVPVPVILYLNT